MTATNSVKMVGYVAQEPQFYGENESGKPTVARFSMSVRERLWSKEANAMDNEDTWFDFVGFGRLASAVQAVVKPGRKFSVLGRLSRDEYEQDGVTRTSYRIQVEDLSVVDWGDRDNESSGSSEPASEELETDEFPF